MEEIILEGKNLTKMYQRNTRLFGGTKESFAAADHINFTLQKGHALGIVGESGSGKSTLARCIADISKLDDGIIYYKGEVMNCKTVKTSFYRKNVRLIYQDSFSSFDPKKCFRYSLKEVLKLRKDIQKNQYDQFIYEIMDELSLGYELLKRYPYEVSGGQCQRMNIARALLLKPEILVLDEPVSALDVTLQVQILELLRKLKEKRNLSYIIISHDLAVIRYICEEACVMYRGHFVESGKTEELFENPQHEYTRCLLR